MNNTQGVIEACYNLFMTIDAEAAQSDVYFYGKPVTSFVRELLETNKIRHKALRESLQTSNTDTIQAGALYALQLGICINDYIKRPGIIESLLHRPRIFKTLSATDIQKLSSMGASAFTQKLFDICTDKGRKLTPADDEGQPCPIMLERCLYAAYVYTQVTEYLEKQNAVFVPISFNKGISALDWINKGIVDFDEKTKQVKIEVNDVVFSGKSKKISTGALMLKDFLLWEACRKKSPTVEVTLREYAEKKHRSTSKQALQKLKEEVWKQMKELIPVHISCQEKIDGKLKTLGQISINGGTAAVVKGVIRWNFNQDLFDILIKYSPTDYLTELWAADPRTSTYYFGKYIIQNRRLNENKRGRDKINIRTLIEKSPNLPTYDEVMNGNRDLTGRIVKKTFEDLDALESLYYEFYTKTGERIDNPDTISYQTFINGYIVVDYSDFPAHPERIEAEKKRKKRKKSTPFDEH